MFRAISNIPRLLSKSHSNVYSTRQISKSTTNYFKFHGNEYEFDEFTPMSWVLLLVPITTLGLGCWQVQRKQWKEGLIRQLETETEREPVPLPTNLDDLASMEYNPVKVRGKFVHDKELLLGPRSIISKNVQAGQGGLITQQNSSTGYLVITPFKLENRDETILINRGWVSRKMVKPANRPNGQVSGTVDVIGLVRRGEGRPQFMPKSTGSNFLYRDVNRMCEITGATPVFLDAIVDSSIPQGGPIGGQTMVTLRNDHLTYLITWFSLSGISAMYWVKKMVRQI